MPKRRLESGSDDDDDEIQPARPTKQARRAIAAATAAAAAAENGDNSDVSAASGGDRSDDDDDDRSDDEGDERLPDHTVVNKKGLACSGVLESVHVQNFMCHKNLVFKLGRNVNIINGPNGSGKSAIVAAVQLGLGGKLSTTGRGSGPESYIQHHETTATVILRIRNEVNQMELSDEAGAESDRDEEGSDSDGEEKEKRRSGDSSTYRHSLYGDAIEIQRVVKKSGSTWFVRNSRQKKITGPDLNGLTPRQEVRNICDHFGFMVDSPTAVLTQQETKKFLADAKPTTHHELFRKSTLLGPLEDELMSTKKSTELIKVMIKQKEDLRPAVEQQITKLKVAYEESKAMKDIGTRIKEQRKILMWTRADEEERELNRYRTQLENDLQPDLVKCQEKEKKIEKIIEDLNQSVQNEDDIIDAAKTKSVSLRAVLTSAVKQVVAAEASKKRKEAHLVTINDKIRQSQKDVGKSEKDLEDAKNLHLGGQQSKAHIAEDLQKCNANIEDIQAKEAQSKVDLDNFNNDQEEERRQVQILRSRMVAIAKDHEAALRDASSNRQHAMSSNSVARFGRSYGATAPKIAQAVQAGRFHYPPLGPVGQYISIKDEFWAKTIEDAVHPSTLKTFLVGDRHDLEELKKLFQNAKFPAPKIVVIKGGLGRTQHHHIPDASRPRVHELGHTTVLDQLKVSNDDIFNLLVDHSQIEANVLVRGQGEMIAVSKNRNLRNVSKCWDEFGNQAYERGKGHVSRPSSRHANAHSMLSMDREAAVRQMEAQATELADQRTAADQDVREATAKCSQSNAAVRAEKQRLTRYRAELQKLMKEKNDLEEKREEASGEFDPLPYEDNIETFKNDLSEYEREKATLEEELTKTSEEIKKAKETKKKASEEDKKAQEELGSVVKKFQNATQKIQKERYNLRRAVSAKKDQEADVQRAHQEISDQQALYTAKLEEAMAVSSARPEMRERKSSDKVEADLNAMEVRLKEEQEKRDGKSADEIETEYLKAQKKDGANRRLIARIKEYHRSLKTGVAVRMRAKKEVEKIIKKTVRRHFNYFLGKRGHGGRISFSSNSKNQQELNIRTHMGSHKTGDGSLHETTDLKSLSGGERSFTTLSFMMALAEVCQNPVRIMDEPDVFMDEASRSTAFKSLIQFCSTMLADRQMILVTPLTIPPGVHASDNVRIQKLAAPRKSGGGSRREQQQRGAQKRNRGQRNMTQFMERDDE